MTGSSGFASRWILQKSGARAPPSRTWRRRGSRTAAARTGPTEADCYAWDDQGKMPREGHSQFAASLPAGRRVAAMQEAVKEGMAPWETDEQADWSALCETVASEAVEAKERGRAVAKLRHVADALRNELSWLEREAQAARTERAARAPAADAAVPWNIRLRKAAETRTGTRRGPRIRERSMSNR